MLTNHATFTEINDSFSLLDSWEDRYKYIIELGQELEPLGENEKNATTKVEGCVSQVWLATSTTISPITSKRLMLFRGDSDSMLVRGIIAIMISLYSQQTPNNILAIDYKAKLAELDLLGHLSAQRSNGVYAMINRIRHEAKATQLATDG